MLAICVWNETGLIQISALNWEIGLLASNLFMALSGLRDQETVTLTSDSQFNSRRLQSPCSEEAPNQLRILLFHQMEGPVKNGQGGKKILFLSVLNSLPIFHFMLASCISKKKCTFKIFMKSNFFSIQAQ